MKALHFITFLLLVIGGLNWLLVGLFGFNLVSYIFGDGSMIGRVVYVLVGISAIYEFVTHKGLCTMCKK